MYIRRTKVILLTITPMVGSCFLAETSKAQREDARSCEEHVGVLSPNDSEQMHTDRGEYSTVDGVGQIQLSADVVEAWEMLQDEGEWLLTLQVTITIGRDMCTDYGGEYECPYLTEKNGDSTMVLFSATNGSGTLSTEVLDFGGLPSDWDVDYSLPNADGSVAFTSSEGDLYKGGVWLYADSLRDDIEGSGCTLFGYDTASE